MASDTYTYTCALDPETNTSIKIYLFKDVQNAETIKDNVINGVWKCAVIKASLVLDLFQVVVAANRAAVAEMQNAMVTKTVHSEILYNLSLTKNISQSLNKFGIDKDTSILVCFLIKEQEQCEDVIGQICGTRCPLGELGTLTNLKDIRSAYKLNNLKSDVGLLDVIVSRMSTKSFVSH